MKRIIEHKRLCLLCLHHILPDRITVFLLRTSVSRILSSFSLWNNTFDAKTLAILGRGLSHWPALQHLNFHTLKASEASKLCPVIQKLGNTCVEDYRWLHQHLESNELGCFTRFIFGATSSRRGGWKLEVSLPKVVPLRDTKPAKLFLANVEKSPDLVYASTYAFFKENLFPPATENYIKRVLTRSVPGVSLD